jgi:hypothetical protein
VEFYLYSFQRDLIKIRGYVIANKKVGVYRRYLEPVPVDLSGQRLPKSDWPKKRSFCWVARWVCGEGKRRSRSFRTKGQAQLFAAQKQIHIQDALSAGLTEISLLDFHTEHRALTDGNVAARTLSLHLATLKMLAACLGWERSLHTVGPRDIERFRASRLSTGIAASTANKDLTVLKRLFNLAILRGYIPKTTNPCLGLPKLRVCAVHKDIIRPEVFTGIYSSSGDAFWRAFLVTLYTAGIRLREATNLTWSDIDFLTRRLHITRKKSAGLVQAWTPKDHEKRLVPPCPTRQSICLPPGSRWPRKAVPMCSWSRPAGITIFTKPIKAAGGMARIWLIISCGDSRPYAVRRAPANTHSMI